MARVRIDPPVHEARRQAGISGSLWERAVADIVFELGRYADRHKHNRTPEAHVYWYERDFREGTRVFRLRYYYTDFLEAGFVDVLELDCWVSSTVGLNWADLLGPERSEEG